MVPFFTFHMAGLTGLVSALIHKIFDIGGVKSRAGFPGNTGRAVMALGTEIRCFHELRGDCPVAGLCVSIIIYLVRHVDDPRFRLLVKTGGFQVMTSKAVKIKL